MSKFTDKIKETAIDMFTYKEKKPYDFVLPESQEVDANYDSTVKDSDNKENPNDQKNSDLFESNQQSIFPSLAINLELIHVKFNTLINSDVKIREFIINARNKQYKAFMVYIDGMVDSQIINLSILSPLMQRNLNNTFAGSQDHVISEAVTNNITVRKVKKFHIADYILDCLVPQNDVKTQSNFADIIDSVNSGNCAMFVDTIDHAYDFDVKKLSQRSVGTPQNEAVIRGSQEAFVENLRTNTSMIRRIMNSEHLVVENIVIGKTNKTNCAVCYMDNIANDTLVAEVKYRLNNINVDYLISSGELEQLIKENNHTSIPEIISTERLDRSTSYLRQGRVVVIYNGCPYSLVMPATFNDFLSSSEDANLNNHFSNLLRILRIFALGITLLLPALYIAVTTFHIELIPTELLYSIVSTRASVPFPILVEILIMELSFELIREAGLRVPGPMGSTLGIVGGLILGQAAVSASIVSPILIIIVAVTGISSFAIIDYSLSFHVRITRFFYTFGAVLCGFLGVGAGLVIHLGILCHMKSFGVSYLAPYAPHTKINSNGIFVKPTWKREKRPSFLNTKRENAQNKYSMGWRQEK